MSNKTLLVENVDNPEGYGEFQERLQEEYGLTMEIFRSQPAIRTKGDHSQTERHYKDYILELDEETMQYKLKLAGVRDGNQNS